jgi:hypothetical protein
MGASLGPPSPACRRLDGVFVFLGDMPRVPPACARPGAGAGPGVDAVAPCFAGRRGHPVLFGKACFPALRAWSAMSAPARCWPRRRAPGAGRDPMTRRAVRRRPARGPDPRHRSWPPGRPAQVPNAMQASDPVAPDRHAHPQRVEVTRRSIIDRDVRGDDHRHEGRGDDRPDPPRGDRDPDEGRQGDPRRSPARRSRRCLVAAIDVSEPSQSARKAAPIQRARLVAAPHRQAADQDGEDQRNDGVNLHDCDARLEVRAPPCRS